jgi:hypothetical protein
MDARQQDTVQIPAAFRGMIYGILFSLPLWAVLITIILVII